MANNNLEALPEGWCSFPFFPFGPYYIYICFIIRVPPFFASAKRKEPYYAPSINGRLKYLLTECVHSCTTIECLVSLIEP